MVSNPVRSPRFRSSATAQNPPSPPVFFDIFHRYPEFDLLPPSQPRTTHAPVKPENFGERDQPPTSPLHIIPDNALALHALPRLLARS